MSKRTLLILSGVFIVFAFAATYSWWSGYISFLQKSPVNSDLDFSAFSKESTDKIVIVKKGEDEKVIAKDGGQWKINGFKASLKEIDEFFEILKGFKVESLVSKNPENYSSFGIDEDAYTLSLTKDGQTSAFIIGDQGPLFGSFYAKKKDGINVYLVAGSISEKLSQDVSGWRDKTLVNVPKEAIQKIEIASKINPLTIIKTQDGKWQAEGSGKTTLLEDEAANRLLTAFNPLEATGFLNEAESKEFEKSSNKTTVRIYDSSQNILAEILLLKKENDYWAQVLEKETIYKIASYKLSDILLDYDEIFKEEKQ